MTTSFSFSEIFRPKTPAQLIGDFQKSLAESLIKDAKSGEFIKELMLIGASGIGKTTILRMYASAILDDEYPDIEELNCSAETGIDDIRNLIQRMQYAPMGAKYSIFYLDEIHGLSKNAQNALLKEIEPVPDHVVLLASTTDPEKIIKTLRGRFQHFELPVPSEKWFRTKASWMTQKAGVKLSDVTIEEILTLSDGSVREFDKFVQAAIKGTFQSTDIKAEDPTSLLYLMFYKNAPIQEWFKAASQETQYAGSAMGLCTYAIKILGNPTSKGDVFKRAQVILNVFGDGLSRNTQEKVSFHKKLLEVYAELR